MKRAMIAMCLAACATPAAPPVVRTLPAGASQLNRALAEHASRAEAWGRQAQVWRFFLAHGASHTVGVELEGDCAIFSAVVLGGLRDADMSVWTAEGEQLAIDEAPDATPVVQLCGLVGRVFVRVHAYDGNSLAALELRRSAEPSDLPGASEGASTYRAAEDDPLDRELRSAGFRRTRIYRFAGGEEQLAMPEGDGCYTLRALGGAAGLHAESALMDASDSGPGAAIQWCTEGGTRVRIVGDEPVELRLYASPDSVGPASLWLGERRLR